MDKIELRNMPLPDLSAEAVLTKAQKDLRDFARRTQMIKSEGILAEIRDNQHYNHD